MSLENTLMADLKEAMKSKNQPSLRGIRAIKAAILLAKTDGSGKELDSAGEIKLLQKLVKQRQESLDIYEKQGREDLASVEKEEIAVIQKYLPAQMSEDEIKAIVQEVMTKTGASGMKDMGKVMGAASAKLAGRADGKTLAAIVKELLA
ncbi:MAG: GatB/YqeY domain-containing protein [Bacteroidota bacterium]